MNSTSRRRGHQSLNYFHNESIVAALIVPARSGHEGSLVYPGVRSEARALMTFGEMDGRVSPV